MVPLVFTGLVERPILFKVMAGSECAETKYGLGAGQAPSGAGNVHAVLDQMATRAFDDACRNGESLGKVAVVMKIRGVVEKIACANINRLARLGGKDLEVLRSGACRLLSSWPFP